MASFSKEYRLYTRDEGTAGNSGGEQVSGSEPGASYAASVIRLWDRPVKPIRQFLCDKRADIEGLPTQKTKTKDCPYGVPTGSEAIVAEDASVWILTNAGEWVDLTSAGSSGTNKDDSASSDEPVSGEPDTGDDGGIWR